MKEKIILGIDPGTQKTGYAILKVVGNKMTHINSSVIKTSPKEPLHIRYHAIFKEIQVIIAEYKPTILSIETQFVQKNIASAMKVSMARAAVLIAATDNNLEIFEYAPKSVKQAVFTSGQASKGQIMYMIQKLLNLKQEIKSDDQADAIALAICHHFRQKRIVYV